MIERKNDGMLDGQLANALIDSDLPTAVRLLAEGASPDACDGNGMPVLAVAASMAWPEAVDALLSHGANPNTPVNSPKRGFLRAPMLSYPAANGCLPVLRAPLDRGAKINAADKTGLTALMSASFIGHTDVILELIARGAEIEQRDKQGYTALMFASNGGRAAAVRALLEAGANSNATDDQGSTPLMFASQHAHDEVVAILLRAGANPDVVGSHGLSAIGFAKQNKHASTLRLLEEATSA
jgi:ankyrin repeat protein